MVGGRKPDGFIRAIMTKRAAGNANQRWIADWLIERGWTVRNFPVISRPIFGPGGKPMTKDGRMIFSRLSLDTFGADLVARRDMGAIKENGMLLWIQASGSSGVKKRVDEFKKYFQFLLPGEHLQLWIKTGTAWNVKEIPITEGAEPLELGKIIRRKFYSASGWEF
jgi:hypothetical protein